MYSFRTSFVSNLTNESRQLLFNIVELINATHILVKCEQQMTRKMKVRDISSYQELARHSIPSVAATSNTHFRSISFTIKINSRNFLSPSRRFPRNLLYSREELEACIKFLLVVVTITPNHRKRRNEFRGACR